MKILFYHLTKKTNKKGLAPIYVRVTISGQRKEYSTGVYLTPTEWDGTQVINNENAMFHNIELNKIRTGILGAAVDVNKHSELDIYSLQNSLTKSQTTYYLMDYLVKFVSNKITTEPLSPKTIEKIKIAEKHIINFLIHSGKSKIQLSQVNCDLGNKLITWCELTKKFGKEHTSKILGILRQTITYGVIHGILQYNPLTELHYKRSKPKPIVALTEKELELFKKHEFKSETLNKVRDLYMLQCLTGLCYIDLMNFDKSKIKKIGKYQVYEMNRQKSKTEAIIPLNKSALEILKRHSFEVPKICNQTFNRYIKEIANLIGINKILTTHTGRKTFGMICISKGYSFESTSKMMGHSSTKITQSVYAKVQSDRVLNEFAKYR